MPPQEQAELWMALRDRMKVDWNQLTSQEKKAGTWDPIDRGMARGVYVAIGVAV